MSPLKSWNSRQVFTSMHCGDGSCNLAGALPEHVLAGAKKDRDTYKK